MKSLTLFMVTSLFLVAAPSATYAGVVPDPVLVPEPSALLIWSGIVGASGMIYWWRKRR